MGVEIMGLNIRLGLCPGTGVHGKVVSKKLSNGSSRARLLLAIGSNGLTGHAIS